MSLAGETFPACACAGAQIEPAVRRCHHPGIGGLPLVGPSECGDCSLRTLEALAAADDDFSAVVLRQNERYPILTPRTPVPEAVELLRDPRRPQPKPWPYWKNAQQAFALLTDEFLAESSPTTFKHTGRGIVLCGGGDYFPSAYVAIRVLRHVGCALPIELWHLRDEMPAKFRAIAEELGVTCIDGEALAEKAGFPLHTTWWRGWQLKPFAVRHSRFAEVLALDADCYPVHDPEDLFESAAYRAHGALFWPDLEITHGFLRPESPAMFGVHDWRDTPAEAGQLVVDKNRCGRELDLALFWNAHADFTYEHLYGDKDTYPLAWRRLRKSYGRPWPTAQGVAHGILHYDDAGRVLFQHRCRDKFRLKGVTFSSNRSLAAENTYSQDLQHEAFCFRALDELTRRLRAPAIVRTRNARQNILQVCPTLGQACGIGNFAANLAAALQSSGAEIETVREIPARFSGTLLIQHEHGIFNGDRLQQQLAAVPGRKILFAHSPGVERFAPHLAGYVCMARGLVQTSLPVHHVDHPANLSAAKHTTVQEALGLSRFTRILGTCGFLSPDRDLETLVDCLLPAAEKHNWLIYLLCSRHAHHDRYQHYRDLETALQARIGPHLVLDTTFHSPPEQARRLRALDVAWCFTRASSRPYASGTASDLYGSGTHLVVQDKQQHAAVLGRENVTALRTDSVHDFAEAILHAASQPPTRHDPQALSWSHAAVSLLDFLHSIAAP